jgi:membrane protease YdiL (CAAX protease family)
VGTEATGVTWPGPVGRPARPHWWSIQRPPPAEPITAGRAYAEALVVFAAFFAASIIAGGETLAHRYPAPTGSWAVFTPAAVAEIATSALAVLVVVLLSQRRGITPRSLGLGMPRKADGKLAAAQSFRIGVWALVALVVGGLITARLATGKLGQPAAQDNSYLLYATTASLAAGIIEETVVLAFVVTTLRQARRPLPEIVIVAILLRCSYHDYYGPGVVGIAVWAAVFIWLFLRTGSVLPLIVVHFLWDSTIFWSQRWHAILTAQAIAFLLLPLAAGISWLAEALKRAGPGQPPPGGPALPYGGWLADGRGDTGRG